VLFCVMHGKIWLKLSLNSLNVYLKHAFVIIIPLILVPFNPISITPGCVFIRLSKSYPRLPLHLREFKDVLLILETHYSRVSSHYIISINSRQIMLIRM